MLCSGLPSQKLFPHDQTSQPSLRQKATGSAGSGAPSFCMASNHVAPESTAGFSNRPVMYAPKKTWTEKFHPKTWIEGKKLKQLLMALHPWRITWNIIMEVWKIIFLSKLVMCRFNVNLPGCKFLMAKAKLALTNKQSATMIYLFLCLMGNCWISCGARSDCVAWNCTSTPGYINYSQPTSPNPREHTKSYRNQLGICRGWHGRVTLKTDPKKEPMDFLRISYIDTCYIPIWSMTTWQWQDVFGASGNIKFPLSCHRLGIAQGCFFSTSPFG